MAIVYRPLWVVKYTNSRDNPERGSIYEAESL
jgi:hypothetical protein